MAKLIILGHGGFGTQSEMTLVPPNTTLKFFADAGSNLMLPFKVTGPARPDPPHWKEGTNWVFDYERVADVLSEFQEREKPLAAGAVVYNMQLQAPHPESQRIANELHALGKWGGDLLMKPDAGEWTLCRGDATTCPTPKLHVAQSRHDELAAKGSLALTEFQRWFDGGASGELPEEIVDFGERLQDVPSDMLQYVGPGVPDDRWKHSCGGILDVGAGYDISWVACSGFAVNQNDLDAIALPEGLPGEVSATTAGPGRDWTPDDKVLDQITALNTQKVKDTPDGGSVSIMVGGPLVLVGEGHAADPANFVRRQADFASGKVALTKGGAFSKGKLDVEGIPAGQQALVVKSIGLFSDKKVSFS
jgi:hypothetical protein